MSDGRFGRLVAPDPHDLLFGMRRAARTPIRKLKRRRWRTGPLLNQGETGTCVGHGWKNWRTCTPVPALPDAAPSAFQIYDQAILVDEFPQNDVDPQRQYGTSVRAGAKVIASLGFAHSYVWGFDAATVADYLLTTSPVVFGANWYSGFDTPDAEGIVRVTGTVRGGHCWLLHGVDMGRGLIEGFNSWGPWGYHESGHFFFSLEDLERLLHEDGEACDAIERRLQPEGLLVP